MPVAYRWILAQAPPLRGAFSPPAPVQTLRTTPAMAANIAKRLWEIGDIMDMLEHGSMGACIMTDDSGLSWEAQEVFQKIKSFNRLPGAGIPLIQLNIKVGSAKTVKKGIRELELAGFITSTASGEPTLTDKGHKTSV